MFVQNAGERVHVCPMFVLYLYAKLEVTMYYMYVQFLYDICIPSQREATSMCNVCTQQPKSFRVFQCRAFSRPLPQTFYSLLSPSKSECKPDCGEYYNFFTIFCTNIQCSQSPLKICKPDKYLQSFLFKHLLISPLKSECKPAKYWNIIIFNTYSHFIAITFKITLWIFRQTLMYLTHGFDV